MKRIALLLVYGAVTLTSANAAQKEEIAGEKVFKTYCWGCHHQTAVAFGPPFEQIAEMRTPEKIRAMIVDPESVSKVLGYRRNAMPKLDLDAEELEAITRYILSFKPKGK